MQKIVDIYLDINALMNQSIENCPLNHFKLGFFPFEIGRGISLGAAYAVTPDLLTYEPGDVIQEFAPGIMFTGILDQKKKLKYRSYLGILKNESANSSDVNEQVRGMQYGHKYFPQRGFGVFNVANTYTQAQANSLFLKVDLWDKPGLLIKISNQPIKMRVLYHLIG